MEADESAGRGAGTSGALKSLPERIQSATSQFHRRRPDLPRNDAVGGDVRDEVLRYAASGLEVIGFLGVLVHYRGQPR